MIATVIKQREEPGLHVDCKILEVRDTDVSGMSPLAVSWARPGNVCCTTCRL